MGPVTYAVVDAASAGAQWAMRQYFEELDRRFDDGFDFGDALEEAGRLYNPPAGAFLLASDDRGEVVGCGAVALLDADTAEIKRMWVSPASRGSGLGRRLLARLEDEVRRSGRTTVVLDTNGVLAEAIALYGRAGYREIDRYNDNPYAEHWFTKSLPRT